MAKYQDIAEEIKQKILREEYEVNTTIPSEFKLQYMTSADIRFGKQSLCW